MSQLDISEYIVIHSGAFQQCMYAVDGLKAFLEFTLEACSFFIACL